LVDRDRSEVVMAKKWALGLIGAGNMAEAIARGVIRSGLMTPAQIAAADPTPQRQQMFIQELRISCGGDSPGVAGGSDTVLLAIKPQVMEEALGQIKSAIDENTLVISIAAGIGTGFIEKTLGGKPRVVRVMPNTPMLVGEGMAGICGGAYATDADLLTAERLFNAGGKTIRVDEKLINAVTASSGSGPAYVFYLVEAMAAAGVKLGLPPEQSALLARQTIIGSAKLLEQSKDSPATLRQKVTSPNGTTQAAIEAMQAKDFLGMIDAAMEAAAKRGDALAK
jgi:pyrroline-5-carboxylate reductase